MLRSLTFAVLTLAFGAFTTTPVQAQCGLPDNLDGGPCCAPAAVNLPAFPQMLGQSALWMCFDDCSLSMQRPFCATIGKPLPVKINNQNVCGQYNARIQLKDCGTNQTHWSGGLRLDYSRTWTASQLPGALNLTVWRFVINGDLIPTAAVPNNPCERPASLSMFNRVYFSGHLDYAFDCFTNTWSIAWSLNHECDAVHHTPQSVRPAPTTGFDRGRTFSIVGPGIGFVPAPTTTAIATGNFTSASLRNNNWSAAPAICTYREPIFGGVNPFSPFCMCAAIQPAAGQFIDTLIFGQGQCGSGMFPTPTSHFAQKRIGSWTNPAVYPGLQDVSFGFGEMAVSDGCTGNQTSEWFEGALTFGGYFAVDAQGLVLDPQFIDLESCNTSATNPSTRIGAAHVSYKIFNSNQP